ADVKSVTKDDGETKEYQNIYNKGVLPSYCLKNFRLVDYNKEEVQNALKAKKLNDLKVHERFVVQITSGDYGNKNAFYLGDLKDYNPSDFFQASDKVILQDDPSY